MADSLSSSKWDIEETDLENPRIEKATDNVFRVLRDNDDDGECLKIFNKHRYGICCPRIHIFIRNSTS